MSEQTLLSLFRKDQDKSVANFLSNDLSATKRLRALQVHLSSVTPAVSMEFLLKHFSMAFRVIMDSLRLFDQKLEHKDHVDLAEVLHTFTILSDLFEAAQEQLRKRWQQRSICTLIGELLMHNNTRPIRLAGLQLLLKYVDVLYPVVEPHALTLLENCLSFLPFCAQQESKLALYFRAMPLTGRVGEYTFCSLNMNNSQSDPDKKLGAAIEMETSEVMLTVMLDFVSHNSRRARFEFWSGLLQAHVLPVLYPSVCQRASTPVALQENKQDIQEPVVSSPRSMVIGFRPDAPSRLHACVVSWLCDCVNYTALLQILCNDPNNLAFCMEVWRQTLLLPVSYTALVKKVVDHYIKWITGQRQVALITDSINTYLVIMMDHVFPVICLRNAADVAVLIAQSQEEAKSPVEALAEIGMGFYSVIHRKSHFKLTPDVWEHLIVSLVSACNLLVKTSAHEAMLIRHLLSILFSVFSSKRHEASSDLWQLLSVQMQSWQQHSAVAEVWRDHIVRLTADMVLDLASVTVSIKDKFSKNHFKPFYGVMNNWDRFLRVASLQSPTSKRTVLEGIITSMETLLNAVGQTASPSQLQSRSFVKVANRFLPQADTLLQMFAPLIFDAFSANALGKGSGDETRAIDNMLYAALCKLYTTRFSIPFSHESCLPFYAKICSGLRAEALVFRGRQSSGIGDKQNNALRTSWAVLDNSVNLFSSQLPVLNLLILPYFNAIIGLFEDTTDENSNRRDATLVSSSDLSPRETKSRPKSVNLTPVCTQAAGLSIMFSWASHKYVYGNRVLRAFPASTYSSSLEEGPSILHEVESTFVDLHYGIAHVLLRALISSNSSEIQQSTIWYVYTFLVQELDVTCDRELDDELLVCDLVSGLLRGTTHEVPAVALSALRAISLLSEECDQMDALEWKGCDAPFEAMFVDTVRSFRPQNNPYRALEKSSLNGIPSAHNSPSKSSVSNEESTKESNGSVAVNMLNCIVLYGIDLMNTLAGSKTATEMATIEQRTVPVVIEILSTTLVWLMAFPIVATERKNEINNMLRLRSFSLLEMAVTISAGASNPQKLTEPLRRVKEAGIYAMRFVMNRMQRTQSIKECTADPRSDSSVFALADPAPHAQTTHDSEEPEKTEDPNTASVLHMVVGGNVLVSAYERPTGNADEVQVRLYSRDVAGKYVWDLSEIGSIDNDSLKQKVSVAYKSDIKPSPTAESNLEIKESDETGSDADKPATTENLVVAPGMDMLGQVLRYIDLNFKSEELLASPLPLPSPHLSSSMSALVPPSPVLEAVPEPSAASDAMVDEALTPAETGGLMPHGASPEDIFSLGPSSSTVEEQEDDALNSSNEFPTDELDMKLDEHIEAPTGLKVKVIRSDAISAFDVCRSFLARIYFGLRAYKGVSSIKVLHGDAGVFHRHLAALDKAQPRECYRIGVIFVRDGQTSQQAILRNSHEDTSLAYRRFLVALGSPVDMEAHINFSGGLDSRTTGKRSIYYSDLHREVMFHVATLMPTHEDDVQQLHKKQHVGNDYVHIVWTEHHKDYSPSTISSNFNFVHIVISPSVSDKVYRIQVLCKQGVPSFGPLQHNMLVHEALLPVLVRRTAITASQLLRQRSPGYVSAHMLRHKSIQDIVRKFATEMKPEDFLSSFLKA